MEERQVIWSPGNGRFPNAGYQWNGSSFLASPAADRKQRLPSQLFYTAGFEAGLTRKITLAVDFMDQWIRDGQRSFRKNLSGPDGNTYQTLDFPYESRHEYNVSLDGDEVRGERAAVRVLDRDVLSTQLMSCR